MTAICPAAVAVTTHAMNAQWRLESLVVLDNHSDLVKAWVDCTPHVPRRPRKGGPEEVHRSARDSFAWNEAGNPRRVGRQYIG